ncbi:MAG TPA: fumarylacetoacetate hydrolase family protein [Microlunatus sp.]|nr:fumarylacetoacetate hydrolase family protein [Microlunatus sp.]
MRIARIAHPEGIGWAVVEDDGFDLIDDPFRTGPDDLRPVRTAHGRSHLPVSAARLLAPVQPRTVVGMAHNTGSADRELAPEAFLKPARSVVGPGAAVELPAGVGRIDAEAELAAVIAADGSVFGWTLANDVTARDLQATDARWAQAKGYRTFTPCGPWIETELDPERVQLELVLNGQSLGSASTVHLARGAVEVLDYLGSFLPLGAQDLVLLGAPGAFGPLTAGTTVTVRSPQLGVLANPVRTGPAAAGPGTPSPLRTTSGVFA